MNSKDKPIVFGVPFEGKGNFFRGTSLGPQKIRWALESIEFYSLYQQALMPRYIDVGDLYPESDSEPEEALKKIEAAIDRVLDGGYPFLALGGDHLITYPLVKSAGKIWNDIHILHIDAHLDRRDSFEGRYFSHATVIRRLEELFGENKICSFGYRSKGPEEKEPACGEPFRVLEPLMAQIEKWKGKPIYLTLDLDVLNPAEFPAVTNPEPGGISFMELLEVIKLLRGKIIGADLVEFNPLAAPGNHPAVTAAVLMREILIALSAK